MTAQLNMFTADVDPNVPHVAGSETSKAAADLIRPRVTRDKKLVYDWLLAFGPATDEEITDAMRGILSENTTRPRRIDLTREGLVFDTGKKRKTRSERDATLWAAKK